MTTALFLLRCVQLGLSMQDLELLTIGMGSNSNSHYHSAHRDSDGILHSMERHQFNGHFYRERHQKHGDLRLEFH